MAHKHDEEGMDSSQSERLAEALIVSSVSFQCTICSRDGNSNSCEMRWDSPFSAPDSTLQTPQIPLCRSIAPA